MLGMDAILVATIAAKEALQNYVVGLKRNRAISVSCKRKTMVLLVFTWICKPLGYAKLGLGLYF